MKKLLIITNLFWVSIFGFMAFKPAAVSSSYHLIDASLAKLMAGDYNNFYIRTYLKKNPMASGVGQNNSSDARTIWFSTKKLRDFMNDMENQSLNNSKNADSLSGLRFYYIKYPLKPAWEKYAYFNRNNLPENYQKLHSLMVVPTYFNKETKTHVDFDPRKYGTNGKPLPISQVFNDLIVGENSTIQEKQSYRFNPRGLAGQASLKAAIIMPDNSDVEANAINAGGLIPPPWNSSNKFITTVPCSGADLMNYIDGIDKCGTQSNVLNTTVTPAKKIN